MKVLIIALLIWLGLAVTVSLQGFARASAPAVAMTVWGLTAAVLSAWRFLPAVRMRIDRLPLTVLIAVHLCRFVGIYFLVLARFGQLPVDFAGPAGAGDIIVALGAVLLLSVGNWRQRPGLVLAWNIVGSIDIVGVVFSALRCGLRDWSSMAPLRELPLSLLPTFVVPLILASHVLIFARLAARSMGSEGFEPPTLSV